MANRLRFALSGLLALAICGSGSPAHAFWGKGSSSTSKSNADKSRPLIQHNHTAHPTNPAASGLTPESTATPHAAVAPLSPTRAEHSGPSIGQRDPRRFTLGGKLNGIKYNTAKLMSAVGLSSVAHRMPMIRFKEGELHAVAKSIEGGDHLTAKLVTRLAKNPVYAAQLEAGGLDLAQAKKVAEEAPKKSGPLNRVAAKAMSAAKETAKYTAVPGAPIALAGAGLSAGWVVSTPGFMTALTGVGAGTSFYLPAAATGGQLLAGAAGLAVASAPFLVAAAGVAAVWLATNAMLSKVPLPSGSAANASRVNAALFGQARNAADESRNQTLHSAAQSQLEQVKAAKTQLKVAKILNSQGPFKWFTNMMGRVGRKGAESVQRGTAAVQGGYDRAKDAAGAEMDALRAALGSNRSGPQYAY